MLSKLVDQVDDHGGALVVCGEPGIGKSALLAAAAARAGARGMRVLRASGVQSEAHLPFAGLHQLLRPILGGAEELPAPQRAALLAAFGMSEEAAPDRFLIALAVLDLVAEAAAATPHLLLVEDAHWLDRVERRGADVRRAAPELRPDRPARGGALGLLDRRSRTRACRSSGSSGSTTRRPRRCSRRAPRGWRRRCASACWPTRPATRSRWSSCRSPRPSSATAALLPPWLPLTERLEQAFAARVAGLPKATRTLLLVAALDDGGVPAEVLSAATLVAGQDPGARGAESGRGGAARRGRCGGGALPPPARALGDRAGGKRPAERLEVHAALARVLADQPHRRVWHRAASVVGTDEQVAAELEAAAGSAQQRGSSLAAIAALERAARLSPEPGARAGRLLRAAELGFELGRRDVVARLLDEVETLRARAAGSRARDLDPRELRRRRGRRPAGGAGARRRRRADRSRTTPRSRSTCSAAPRCAAGGATPAPTCASASSRSPSSCRSTATTRG